MAELELHFGAGLALGVHETAKQARWMEELGYEYISCGEHFMRGDPPGPTHAALPVLAVAAGATEKHIEPDKSVKFIRLEVQYSMSQIGGSQPHPIWSKRSDQGPIQISWLKVLRYIRPLEIAGVL